MQGVKAYTTAARIIEWCCQQMINIHQHSGHHDQIGSSPVSAKEKPRNDGWDNKV